MTFQDFLGRPRTLVSLVRFYSTNQENSRFFEKLQEFQGCQLAVHGPQVVPRSPAVPRLGLAPSQARSFLGSRSAPG